MSDTPRTDARWAEEWELWRNNAKADPAHGMCDFAASLERELSQVEKKAARWDWWVKHWCAHSTEEFEKVNELPDGCADSVESFNAAVDAALQSEKGKE